MTVASGAVCAKHPGVAAIDTCARCGSFVCEECEELSVTDEVFCAACYQLVKSAAPTLQSFIGRGFLVAAVVVLLLAWAGGGFAALAGAAIGVPGMVLTALERVRRIMVPRWVRTVAVIYVLQVALFLALLIWALRQ